MPQGYSFLVPGLGPVTALAAWQVDATRRNRALPQQVARGALATLVVNASDVALQELYTLAVGVERDPNRGLGAAALIPAIDAALESGSLLLFGGWETGSDGLPAGDGEATGPSQDAVLASRIMRGNRAILFEGYRYRFVAAGERSWGSDNKDEEPVPLDKARPIVAKMSGKVPRNALERESWKEMSERLTDDDQSEGIRLVRVVFVGGAIAPEVSEAVSPSAMRAAAEAVQHWIEVKVCYEDGAPFTGNVIVELPDGRKTEGAPNEAGLIRIDSIDPGSCKVSIPELDAAAWRQA